MMPSLARHEGVHIVAAADPRTEAREAFVREVGGSAFEDTRSLFEAPLIDAVYIATPTYLHVEHAVLAANAGKHIIIEKPLALTLEGCDRIADAVRTAGVHLVCGHTHAFDPPIVAMADLVRSGVLGRLLMVHTWNYNEFLIRPRPAWELDRSKGGGVIMNQAPHQIEILRTISSAPLAVVRGRASRADPNRPTEGGFAAYLESGDGTPCTAVYSGYGFFDTAELHFWRGERGEPRHPGSHRRAWAEYKTHRGESPDAEDRRRDARRFGAVGQDEDDPATWTATPFFGFTLVSLEGGDVRQTPQGLAVYAPDGVREIPVPGRYAESVRAVIDELCEAVAKDEAPRHGPGWATGTVEAALAIASSSESGREVVLMRQNA